MPEGDLLDYDQLARRFAQTVPAYRMAFPFPHVVIDEFLSANVLRDIVREVPALPGPLWASWDGPTPDGRVAQQGKHHISNDADFGPITRRLVYEMRAGRFLRLLSTLSGIDDLIADPYNEGGGLHYSGPGALLRIHTDPLRHGWLRLERRLNLLLYLSPDWQEKFGGHLELWPPDMSACAQRIVPTANRCVVFSTSPVSYHGHPEPLRCPRDRGRLSLAMYYFTNMAATAATPAELCGRFPFRPGE